jgi:hypothetical protein
MQSEQAVHATGANGLKKVVAIWCVQLLRGIDPLFSWRRLARPQ